MLESHSRRSRVPKVLLRRSLHIQNAGQGVPRAFLTGNTDSKYMLRLLKSPGQVFFVAANVAMFLHLKHLSTSRQKRKMKHLSSQADELEDYETVISDLDRENEEIQKQILELKARKENEENSVSGDIKSSLPPVQRQKVLTPKEMKYMRIHRKVLEDQRMLANSFVESRSAIASALSDPEAIAQLFASDTKPHQSEEPQDFESDPSKRSYSSHIANTMMSISHSLITKCVVDLNLRFALFDTRLKNFQPSSASFYRQGLFKAMLSDEEKSELLQRVAELRSEKVSSSKAFLKQLDSMQVEKLFKACQLSDQFSSTDLQRYDMYINRSGRWRNYENSDAFPWIKAAKGPEFQSSSVDNTEYLTKFGQLFSDFSSSSRLLKHVNLVLEIAKVLASGGQFTPSSAIFRDLLDKFGTAKLYSYQSLVYEHLPAFKERDTVWADGRLPNSFAEKSVSHFQHLIEDDPRLLESLINYSATRQDTSMVKNFIKLLEPTPIKTPSSESILPHFMTGQWLSRGSKQQATFSKPVHFEKSVIQQAIQESIKSKDHKAIDKLLTKLVYNSVQTENGPRVYCGDAPSPETLMVNNYAAKELASEIFDERLLKSLGKHFMAEEDNRRCAWLAPLIRDNIERTCSPGLQKLYKKLSSAIQPPRPIHTKEAATEAPNTIERMESWKRETVKPVAVHIHRNERMAPFAA